MARDKLVHFYGRGKGKGLVWVVMEAGGELCLPASPNVQVFNEGDMVHVFEGTGAGNVRSRDVGWFGKVVGRDGDALLGFITTQPSSELKPVHLYRSYTML